MPTTTTTITTTTVTTYETVIEPKKGKGKKKDAAKKTTKTSKVTSKPKAKPKAKSKSKPKAKAKSKPAKATSSKPSKATSSKPAKAAKPKAVASRAVAQPARPKILNFKPGQSVRVHGLKQDISLNGRVGEVVKIEGDRVSVFFDVAFQMHSMTRLVCPSNLMHSNSEQDYGFRRGQMVKAHGLVVHTHLNGVVGEIQSFRGEDGISIKWVYNRSYGETIIRPANLQALSQQELDHLPILEAIPTNLEDRSRFLPGTTFAPWYMQPEPECEDDCDSDEQSDVSSAYAADIDENDGVHEYYILAHSSWSKWNQSGEDRHHTLGPFATKRLAVAAAEVDVGEMWGWPNIMVELKEEIDFLLEDRRKNPPDNGRLLIAEDLGSYCCYIFDIEKVRKGEQPSRQNESASSDGDDGGFW